MEDKKNQADSSTIPADTTPKVAGIGGIFFYSDKPKETREWHTKNLGIEMVEGLVKKLKENGATIIDSIASYDYGKFIHIMDAEGKKIELWEPKDKIK